MNQICTMDIIIWVLLKKLRAALLTIPAVNGLIQGKDMPVHGHILKYFQTIDDILIAISLIMLDPVRLYG